MAITVPPDINPLSPTGFRMTIGKFPEVTYFCQEINIPSLSLGSIDFNTRLATIPVPGETMTYSELDVEFLIDEKMTNYISIFDWLNGLGYPESNQQYIDFLRKQNNLSDSELVKNQSDGFIEILGSNNLAIRTISFIDLSPTSLNGLTFHSTVTGIDYLIGKATFKFSAFHFDAVNMPEVGGSYDKNQGTLD